MLTRRTFVISALIGSIMPFIFYKSRSSKYFFKIKNGWILREIDN